MTGPEPLLQKGRGKRRVEKLEVAGVAGVKLLDRRDPVGCVFPCLFARRAPHEEGVAVDRLAQNLVDEVRRPLLAKNFQGAATDLGQSPVSGHAGLGYTN